MQTRHNSVLPCCSVPPCPPTHLHQPVQFGKSRAQSDHASCSIHTQTPAMQGLSSVQQTAHMARRGMVASTWCTSSVEHSRTMYVPTASRQVFSQESVSRAHWVRDAHRLCLSATSSLQSSNSCSLVGTAKVRQHIRHNDNGLLLNGQNSTVITASRQALLPTWFPQA